MTAIDLLEGAMLAMFSVSWFWSIAAMLRTRVATGKSLLFPLIVCLGYLLGLTSKLLLWLDGGDLSPLVWVYLCNFALVCVDAALIIRFTQSARRARPVAAA